MGSASIDMKEDGPKKKTGRKYSVISAPGCIKPAPVTEFKGKSLCIVFYPEKALFMLDEKSCIRHVMTTSLEPSDAVASALEAANIIKTYNLPDPISCRRLTGGRDFQKKSFDRFKRKSFYDMELNKESGQIKYLGEAELLGQCHVPFVQSMMEGGS